MERMTIRFHLDENMQNAIAAGLRLRGVDVTTTVEANLRESSDEEHLLYAIATGRVVVTQDDDFLSLAPHYPQHPGIVLWNRKRHFGSLIRDLDTLCEARSAEEMVGCVVYL